MRWTASSILIATFYFIATALAETADKIGTARTDAIQKLDLQTEFPQVKPPPEPINWGHWNFTIPPELLWILLAGLIVLAIWMLWEPLTGMRLPRRAKRPEAASESTEGEAAAAEPGLAASAWRIKNSVTVKVT